MIADLTLIDKSDLLWMAVHFKPRWPGGFSLHPGLAMIGIQRSDRPRLLAQHDEGMRLLHRLARATEVPLEAIGELEDPVSALPDLFIGKKVNLTVKHEVA